MKCDYLKILNLSHDGSWDEAHKLIQKHSDDLSCRIHAYLHRVEGNIDNAKYWYERIGIDMPNNSLEDELNNLHAIISKSKIDN